MIEIAVRADRTRRVTLASQIAVVVVSSLQGCGGADAAAAFNDAVVVTSSGEPLEEEPEVDTAVRVTSSGFTPPTSPVAPGDRILVTLPYVSMNEDVVGAAVRFGTSGPIHTFYPDDLRDGSGGGVIQVLVDVPADVCDGLSAICHDIKCYEYAVTSAGTVSRANIQAIALKCGSCDEPSCQDLLTECTVDDPGTFAGTYGGGWGGTCDTVFGPFRVSGTFSFSVSDDGEVSGAYEGDDAGDVEGAVSAAGTAQLSAGGSAGGCAWSGAFTPAGDVGGGWSCGADCAGSWSGTRH